MSDSIGSRVTGTGRSASEAGTRNRLIESALELFALNGYDAVSTREICQHASSNLGSIKYHFGGKEGLYLAVVEQVVADMQGFLLPAVAGLIHGVAAAAGDRAVLTRLASDYVDRSVHGFLGDPLMRHRLALIMREYAAPTSAFDVIYRDFIEPHHGAVNLLVAAVIGLPADGPETIIRTHSLIGQIMVLLIGRPVLLRRLEWDEFSPRRIDQVSSFVTRSVLASLGLDALGFESPDTGE